MKALRCRRGLGTFHLILMQGHLLGLCVCVCVCVQVSTMKYTLLQIFIELGYDTLITDMDLVYFQNPFHHLHR